MRFGLVLALGAAVSAVAAVPVDERSSGCNKGKSVSRTSSAVVASYPTASASKGSSKWGKGDDDDDDDDDEDEENKDDEDDEEDDNNDDEDEDDGDDDDHDGSGNTGPTTSRGSASLTSTRSATISSPTASSPTSSSPSTPSATTTPDSGSGSVWQPAVGATWQIMLSTLPDPESIPSGLDAFDIDLEGASADLIQQIQAKGLKVICYFSAGSSEDWRSDYAALEPYMGSNLDGWPGENWIDIRESAVREVMSARIADAAAKGCDAIDPDNMDGYGNDNGLGLAPADTVDYFRFLSTEAVANGMSIGLKNAGEVIEDVLPYAHFSVNEQCAVYDECDTFAKFIDAGKPVFNIEYVDDNSSRRSRRRSLATPKTKRAEGTCPTGDDRILSFSSLLKEMDLGEWFQQCKNGVAGAEGVIA